MGKFDNSENKKRGMTTEELDAASEACYQLGILGAKVFQGALKESGNVEIAAKIARIYLETLIKPDSLKFFF